MESPHKLSKYQWKNRVKSAILRKNKDDILKRLEKSKNIDVSDIQNENFGKKEYFKKLNSEDARLRFAIRSRMTITVNKDGYSHIKFRV